jgi:hypothetical protein
VRNAGSRGVVEGGGGCQRNRSFNEVTFGSSRRIYGSALPVDLLHEASASLSVWLVRLWLEPTKFGGGRFLARAEYKHQTLRQPQPQPTTPQLLALALGLCEQGCAWVICLLKWFGCLRRASFVLSLVWQQVIGIAAQTRFLKAPDSK